jgi:alkyl hydroperoxide reductase subunit AhpC
MLLIFYLLGLAYCTLVQKKAPNFIADAVVPGGDFKTLHLDDFKGKYLILLFYPLDFTFVCPTELIAFSDRIEEFKALNAEILACSIDSKHAHLAWSHMPRNKGGLGNMQIPMLADVTKKIARDYGVLIEDGADEGIALRGTFIIDPDQILRIAHINDLPVGRSVDEIKRVLEALQFHAEHGEVCPANWKKGSLGMKDNPIDSLKYFEKVNSEL